MVRNWLRAVVFLLSLGAGFVRAQSTTSSAATEPAEPPPGVVRVACIGDSITYGAGIANREQNSYPAKLGGLLGDGFAVRNFGVNGTTALKVSDRPYVERPIYAKALAYKADVLVMAFGTNDTKPQNWKGADAFTADYKAILADFRKANPAVKVFVCLPVQCFLDGEWSIRDHVIRDEVIPAVKKIAAEEKATVIDLRSALNGKHDLFPDNIHPNAEGAAIMAKTVAAAVKS
ncbi:MAG: GDSL-type esterase/lipase family protein [Tepidisphaeraceae bacterium]